MQMLGLLSKTFMKELVRTLALTNPPHPQYICNFLGNWREKEREGGGEGGRGRYK